MQYMPDNFFVGWDALALIPAAHTGKLFAKAIAAETRNTVGTVTVADVLKAIAKCDTDEAPRALEAKVIQSIVAVVRLLASDIYNLQTFDDGAFRKRMARQIAKVREVTDADEALFESIGAALSEETVAPRESPPAAVGGSANIIALNDLGVETNLVTGKQRIYATATAVDATRYSATDAATVTFHPTAAEGIKLAQTPFEGQ